MSKHLSAADDERIKLFIKNSEGWLTYERAIEMAELVLTIEPQIVVEIGVFGARSLIPQALALKQIGRGKIYGIDSWKTADNCEGDEPGPNKDWWEHNVNLHEIHIGAMEAIWNFGLDETAIILRSASQYCADLFQPETIDILNIDGNHTELASTRDVSLYLPRVKHNGYVWMDDCDWPSTQKAQAMLDAECVTLRNESNGHYKLFCKNITKRT